MTETLQELKTRYVSVLQRYLKDPDEAGLQQAYELGREAAREGVGILDIARVHQEALEEIQPHAWRPKERARATKEAGNFFAECLSPFEMTHRGFQEANATLRRLNETLERHAAELAEANRELQNEIYERKQAEAALERLSRQHELILKSAGEGICGLDMHGYITFVNPAVARMTGWGVEELIGKSQHETLHHSRPDRTPYPPEECPLHQALRDGRIHHAVDEVFWKKDGSSFYVEGTSMPILDDGGELVGAVVTFRDITARKEAEKSLYQLSGRLLRLQDEERRRMARELHDTTGQTLAALAVNLSMANSGLSSTNLDERTRRALSEAVTLVEECSREIRTLSYLLHPPLLDELGLAATLRWYADGFSRRSGIQVDLELPADFRRMPREAEMTLFRIVQESLTNIHRHSGSPTAQIRVALDLSQVALEVSDNGRGMDSGSLEGSGGISSLGVGIAGMRERVRQLGGRLEIQSNKNGTTVRALLPIAVKNVAQA